MSEAGATGEEPVLLHEVRDGVATVWINRPKARNALNAAVRGGLPRLLSELDGRDDVDVIVLTGTDPAFSAGVDLKELVASTAADDEAVRDEAAASLQGGQLGPVPPLEAPLIGAINGVAITGGFELALACDFLIASERAAFADTHARMGIMPGWGLTVRLAERVGVAKAKEISATGNFVDAEHALRIGLVNHVVPHDELLPFTWKMAGDIASNDRRGVRRMLATYDEAADARYREAWALEAEVSRAWAAEGYSADDLEARRRAVTERGRTQQS